VYKTALKKLLLTHATPKVVLEFICIRTQLPFTITISSFPASHSSETHTFCCRFHSIMSEVYTVKVEEGRPATSDGRPSVGPVYRCIYAKDGLMELPSGLESPWEFFRSIFYLLIYFMSLML